jgi:hypothetical protein
LNKQLTESQQNLVKDILKVIGKDDQLNAQFAKAAGMSEDEFDEATEEIFRKLGNGRVTVES